MVWVFFEVSLTNLPGEVVQHFGRNTILLLKLVLLEDLVKQVWNTGFPNDAMEREAVELDLLEVFHVLFKLVSTKVVETSEHQELLIWVNWDLMMNGALASDDISVLVFLLLLVAALRIIFCLIQQLCL